MNNQNAKNEIVVKYNIGDDEIKLTPKIVQDYIVGTDAQITMQEFKLFTELCKVRKLNPFLREAYLIKYKSGTPASIVVGKDAIVKRAVLNSQFNGMESGIIVTNTNDEVIERPGTFKLPTEKLVGAWARVYRKDWEYPVYQSVSIDEAIQKKSDGTINSNWTKQPGVMIEKVAKVRALREAFVEDLSGMYEAEEMNVELPVEEKITGKDKLNKVVQDAVVVDAETIEPEKVSFEDLD